ncbi:MAG TPA: hypothetical protein VK427_10310, partial [Kofleriaceae bacterium]|nr:hypothetical protein [Kofleriaceae bacterium]
MKLLVVLLAAGIGVTSARAERVRVPTPLETLAAAAKCDDKASPWRPWCIATKFEQGTAAALPSKNLVGLTVALETGKDVATALRDRVTFVALAVTRDGTLAKLKLTDVTPESEAERTQVAEAVAAAT